MLSITRAKYQKCKVATVQEGPLNERGTPNIQVLVAVSVSMEAQIHKCLPNQFVSTQWGASELWPVQHNARANNEVSQWRGITRA